jgi:hypothetical protein
VFWDVTQCTLVRNLLTFQKNLQPPSLVKNKSCNKNGEKVYKEERNMGDIKGRTQADSVFEQNADENMEGATEG